MVAATSIPPHALSEQRIVIYGVRWDEYLRVSDSLEGHGVRLTYLKGALEIMSPSEAHERAKKIVARLIETYAFFLSLRFNGYGSTTFRKKAKERGVEPDECYVLGRELKGDFPDIVLEVIETVPLVDKLDVYGGLGVAEVWTWQRTNRAMIIHVLRGSGYVVSERSALLPRLDAALLASYVRAGESHTALVKAYRTALRALAT
jgi:Uma2 family endonuclease